MKKKSMEEKMEVEWDPEPILNVIYYQADEKRVLASVDGKFLGFLYVVDMSQERPQVAIQVPKIPQHILYFQEDLLFIGSSKGSYQIRHRTDLSKELSVAAHDIDTGLIRHIGLSYDKKCIISAAKDGTIHVKKYDFHNSLNVFQGSFHEEYTAPEIDTEFMLESNQEDSEDILDDKIYSIQQAKLLAE